MKQALAGRRVLVTRARQQAGKLSAALAALGAVPVEVPVLEIVAPRDGAPLDECLRQINQYQWLILTSANTVRVLTERAGVLGVNLGAAFAGGTPQVALVGKATAEAAVQAGLPITLVPEQYVAESLVKAMTTVLAAGDRVLLARAETARDVIPDALRAMGVQVDVVDAYRNRMPLEAPELLRQACAEGIDAATFTSSSSVTQLRDAVQAAGLEWPLAGVQAVSIGPVTTATLIEAGWPPVAEADPYDIAGLVAATATALL